MTPRSANPLVVVTLQICGVTEKTQVRAFSQVSVTPQICLGFTADLRQDEADLRCIGSNPLRRNLYGTGGRAAAPQTPAASTPGSGSVDGHSQCLLHHVNLRK
jgi:hypothetical protein